MDESSKPHASTGAGNTELKSADIILPSVWKPLGTIAFIAFALFATGVVIKYVGGAPVDWYEVLSKLAAMVLLCSGFGSFLMVRRQMVGQQKTNLQTRERETKEFQYNRVEAFYRYFGAETGKETQATFVKFVEDAELIPNFSGEGLTIENEMKLTEICTNAAWDSAVRAYLDRHEGLAAAVNSGFIDDDVAYGLQGSRIIRAVKVFRVLIKKWQTQQPLAYCELLKLDADWQLRRHTDGEERRRLEMEENVRQGKGQGQIKKLPK